jgi:acyl-coenzyme A synthetase/AMP-(fatty) acid ligase
MTPLPDAIREIGRAQPGAVAVIDGARQVTYAELDLLARRMAAWLERQGLRPGERVGLTLRGNLTHLVATLGLMRLGCDQVGLASHDTPAMRAEIAARAGLVAVACDGAADALPGLGCVLLDAEAAAREATRDDHALPAPGAAGTTVLIPSSGTTGRPKLVPLSERLILLRGLMRLLAPARRCSPIAMEFPQARWAVLMTLAAGGTQVFFDAAAGVPLLDHLRRHRVQLLTLAPARAEALLPEARRHGWPEGLSLHLVGAPTPGDLRRRVEAALTPALYVHYGATECSVVAVAMPGDHARHPDGVGRPWGASAMVVDAAGRALPPGEPGVLRILTAGRAPGYLDDAEAARQAFLPGGWYHTGDVATLAPDGTIVFGGRADDMMLLGNINIHPAEIERAAAGFPGLADCAAFARPSATHGDVPVLAAVETGPGALDPAALQAHCRALLGLRAPRQVVVVPALPRNGAGKVVRRDLAALALGGRG